MNKKGYLSSFIFGMFGLFVLILILVTLLPVKYSDMEINESVNALEKTQASMLTRFALNESQSPVIKVTYKFVDFIVYSGFEIAKLGVVWGNENLGATAVHLILWLIVLSMLVPVVVGLFKILIVVAILVYDFFIVRKEKKDMKKLEINKQENKK